MNYLDSLNEEQKKAVLATEGPVMIVAGAGAGKTKTITHRIMHLIHKGVYPDNILAITFTNKAAKEMRERVLGLIDSMPKEEETRGFKSIPFVSTFHSLGVRIIKENAELVGISRHFTIYDKTDSKKVIKDAIASIDVDPKEYTDKVMNIISGEKGRGVTYSEYAERAPYDYTSELTKKVWAKYESQLKKEQALDFDDLLLKSLVLLKKHKEVLNKYHEKFLYIHIDEYQDTNGVQNEIVELLASKHKNICVVGDTDQNIYSWRGAEIKNMLHFEKTYPHTHTIFLEQNYRSTKTILAVANNVIEKNNIRIPKKLFTENVSGEKISIFRGRSEIDEAHFIALTAKELVDSGKVKSEEIAVLYRANFQSRALEEACMAYALPYQMLGTKFFERKEIKDCVAYIQCALNSDNTTSYARIINTPARGIGKVTLDKILEGKESELSGAVQLKINTFKEKLKNYKKILETEKPSVSIKFIIMDSGIEGMYTTGKEEDTERLENCMELVTLAKRYDEYEPEDGIEKFLTDSALASDQDGLSERKDGIKLMTVHASKGLEFDYVFISGLEAGLFPHSGFGEKRKTKEESEEERRLFYVAITRARKKIYLCYAETRTIFGKTEINSPSEFLDDIPDEHSVNESYGGQTTREPLFSIDF